MRLSLYRYTVLNDTGTPRVEHILAPSQQMALSQLLRSSIQVVGLKKESVLKIKSLHFLKVFFKLTSSKTDFVNWWIKELTDLLLTGFSLRLALEDTLQKTRDWYYKQIISQVYSDLLSGDSLCSALSRAKLFSGEELVILYTAEENHFLIRALEDIYRARMEKKENQYKGSLFLVPIILLCIVTMCASAFVAHNILNIYMYDLWLQGKATPPLVALFMKIYAGDSVVKLAIALAIFLFLKILLLILRVFNFQFLKRWDEFLSTYMPIKKTIMRRRYSAYFLSALSPILNSGAALHAALYQCSKEISHRQFKQEILLSSRKVYEGEAISKALEVITFLDAADKLVLQSSLAHYSVDGESIEHLSRYTTLKLKKIESLLSRLAFSGWILILILLILFTISSSFLLIYVDSA